MISIHIWSENLSPKSEANMAEVEELLDVSSSPSLLFLFARSDTKLPGVCRIFVFWLRLKTNISLIFFSVLVLCTQVNMMFVMLL